MVLAHGAGAGKDHAHMHALARSLLAIGIAVLRFDFPFVSEGRRRVDAQHVSIACVRAAVDYAAIEADGLPVLAGGHSFGGRMTSHAAVDSDFGAGALVFFSFPLHPAGKPGVDRAAHLPLVAQPMLFVSGTRDALADPGLLTETVDALDRARLAWVETADHSMRILKRQRPPGHDVYAEISGLVNAFLGSLET